MTYTSDEVVQTERQRPPSPTRLKVFLIIGGVVTAVGVVLLAPMLLWALAAGSGLGALGVAALGLGVGLALAFPFYLTGALLGVVARFHDQALGEPAQRWSLGLVLCVIATVASAGPAAVLASTALDLPLLLASFQAHSGVPWAE